jgi:hypothetical protein
MPPLATLTPKHHGTVTDLVRAPFGEIGTGEIVSHGGRLYFILGFDAAGAPVHRAYLEDVETHEVRSAALTELTASSRAAA